ncbi:MAG: hypothetical protein ACRYFW_16615 [Janthinobacterium lividum]
MQYPVMPVQSRTTWASLRRRTDVLLRKSFVLPSLLLIVGAMWRVWWVRRHFTIRIGGEAGHVALSFARDGTIADTFYRGERPTTHLSPIAPIIDGSVLRLLGIETRTSTWALSFLAIGCCLGAAIVLYRAFAVMGVPRASRLAALALACLLPLNQFTETDEFRFWEGGMAVLLSAAILWLTVAWDRGGAVDLPRIAALALLVALLAFVSPALGLAGYANLALLLWRRVPARRWAPAIAVAALALAAVLTPWTIRNYAAFGRFVPLRGNAGLELALANHPAAVSGTDAAAVFRARERQIHPDGEPAVIARMRAEGGEIPYADRLGREARAWIGQHPGDFVRLSLRHLRQFFFPPRWFWTLYGERERGVDAKWLLTGLTGLAGLAGAAACLLWWRERMLYAATIVLMPALPYMVVQPILRYRYLVLFPLMFLGVEVTRRLWVLATERRSTDRRAA